MYKANEALYIRLQILDLHLIQNFINQIKLFYDYEKNLWVSLIYLENRNYNR